MISTSDNRNNSRTPHQGPRPNYVISPSNLTFEWQECPLCFYRRMKHGFKRPSTPMPAIFTSIDAMQKRCFDGQRTELAGPDVPAGQFTFFDEWVESVPLSVPRHTATITLRGKIDTCLALDDGSHCMCDFKTSSPREPHVPLYGRQLHSYAIAAENPAPSKLALPHISRLGLLVFEPLSFRMRPKDSSGPINSYFGGAFSWREIPRDDEAFFEFLASVLDVLESPVPPGGSPNCSYCNYIDIARRTGL